MNVQAKHWATDPRYIINADGSVIGPSGKALRPRKNQQGYARFTHVDRGKNRDAYVHRVVCETFNGAPPTNDHQVDHINGVRDDNRAENLRWVTKEENLKHRIPAAGERSPNSKLTCQQVREIRSAKHYRGFDRDFAKALGVSREVVRDVRNGKSWRGVS